MSLIRLINAMSILQCPKLTTYDAVATHHAATTIYAMRLGVDTCRLTVLRTQRAVLTLLCVEMNLQEREAADEAKDGAYRAYRVTICPAISEGKHEQDECCNTCH
jgi:hypothetical protein